MIFVKISDDNDSYKSPSTKWLNVEHIVSIEDDDDKSCWIRITEYPHLIHCTTYNATQLMSKICEAYYDNERICEDIRNGN